MTPLKRFLPLAVVIFANELAIEHTTIATAVSRCANWRFSIDVYIHNFPASWPSENFWTSIFQVTAQGSDDTYGSYGSRIPALMAVNIEGGTVEISAITRLGGNNNYKFNYKVDWNTWINVEMSENDGQYTVAINNQIVHSVTNPSPLAWDSVDIVMARPALSFEGRTDLGYYPPTPGMYRNFVYDLCVTTETTVPPTEAPTEAQTEAQTEALTTTPKPDSKVAAVSCMNGDIVEMTANINESDVQNDLSQEGWTLANGIYAKTWLVSDFSYDEITVDGDNNLVLTKSQITDCKQVTYDEKTVCISVGMELTFRCRYALGDITLSSDVAVSGHDDEMDAEGEGELIYTMEATSEVQIGKSVEVSITPKNPNLVFASIHHCRVVYGDSEMPLMIGSSGESDASYNLEPVCVFGTEIPNSSNMQTLDFSFTAFKWSSAASDSFAENQKVECTIKLTKDEPAHTTGKC